MSLTTDKHSFEMDEYYFDEKDESIMVTGTLVSDKGESFISVNVPLSDTVLLDILQYSVKKLNKLKTALETLR